MKQIIAALLSFNFLTILCAQHTSTFSDPTLGNSQVQNGSVITSYELYTIHVGSIKLPITLNYGGARGIKVNEIASRVGLGWDLNAGGYISRVVVGYPDDEYKDKDNKEGILFNDNLIRIENLNIYEANTRIIKDIIKKDFEPDIFRIHTPTFSSRFLFDESNNIISIDDPNLRITYQHNAQGKLISFTVMDDKGLIYLFDKISTTTEKTNFQYPSSTISGKEYVEHTYNSVWHLSKIRDAWSNYIDFSYNTETINYLTNKVEKAKVFKREGDKSYPTVVGYDFIGSTEVIQSNNVLSTITTSQGENIKFTRGSSRSDLSGGKSLRAMNINNGNINYEFITGYLGSFSSNYRLILNRVLKNNKIFLDFTYDAEELPPRLSFEQDFWGYYNNNSAQTLIPKVYIDENASDSKSFVDYGYSNFNSSGLIVLDGANRKSTLNSEAGILKEIVDMKGAKRIFQYELNEFEHEGKHVVGNGLRIKKIIDSDGSRVYERTFTYQKSNGGNSGSVVNVPLFSYITPWRSIKYIKNERFYEEVESEKYRIVGYQQGGYIYEGPAHWSTTERYDITTVRFAFPVNSIFDEYEVFYDRIVEESNFFIGKKIYEYDVPQYLQSMSDVKRSVPAWDSDDANFSEDPDPDLGSFPYVPSVISIHNAAAYPSSIQFIDSNNNLVYTESYIYDSKEVHYSQLVGLKCLALEWSVPLLILDPSILASPFAPIKYLFSKYYIVKNQYRYLASKTTKEILNNGDFELSKSFEYYIPNFIKKEHWQDSEGNIYEKHFRYAFNFFMTSIDTPGPPGSDTDLFKKLSLQNRPEPIEIVTFKNGRVISGEIYKYRLDNEFINLAEKKTFELKDTNSNTPYDFASLSGPNLIIDSRYTGTEFFDVYDAYGNVLQKHQSEGIPTSYIYGYNGKHLIAELKNVYYTSIPESLRNSLATTTDENALLTLQNQLRNAFPSGHISTYTYFPHIGKRTQTNERGETIYYEYDEFNRLKTTKDVNGNLVEGYQYNYKIQ